MDREEAVAGGGVCCGVSFADQLCCGRDLRDFFLKMSSDSRSRSRSRSPMDRKIRSDRFSYRDAPYRRDSRSGFRFFFPFLTFYLVFALCT